MTEPSPGPRHSSGRRAEQSWLDWVAVPISVITELLVGGAVAAIAGLVLTALAVIAATSTDAVVAMILAAGAIALLLTAVLQFDRTAPWIGRAARLARRLLPGGHPRDR